MLRRLDNNLLPDQKNVIGFVSFATQISETHDNKVTVKGLEITAASEDEPPFDVDGIAFEQDTLLIMGVDKIDYPSESFDRLVYQLNEMPSFTPGTVLVRGRNPFRFLAIVHDINKVPTWKEEWISSSLDRIFQECERLKIESAAVPMLGTLHGNLEKQHFVYLLRSAIEKAAFEHLKKLWLIIPVGDSFEKYIDIMVNYEL